MLEFVAESPPSAAFDHEAWARVYNATEPQVEYQVNAEALRRGDAIRAAHLYARRVLAYEGGELVGCALAMHLPYIFDPGRLWVWVAVLPAHQGRGVGAAIFDEMLGAVRAALEPTQLVCRVSEAAPRSLRFLHRRGFEVRQRAVPSRLMLSELTPPDPRLFDRLRAEGVEITSLATLRDRDPDWQRKGWALNAEIESRLPSAVPVTPISFEEFVKIVYESPSLCWDATQFAVTADNQYIGLSALYEVKGAPTCRQTGLTGVHSSYLRRGVATALKLAAAQRAAAEGVEEIHTENASTNPMLALNLALGFRPRPAICVLFCDLT